jgi:3'(2'), 5'-bisphosphate nucleotidase
MMRIARQFQINKTDLRWINMHPLPPDVTSAVCRLADQAGALILGHYQAWSADLRLANKADDSPLTQADLAAHDCIAKGLSKLTPNIPVVSEEDVDSHATRTQAVRYWLIDPLDGTREFLDRNGEFTVNIALIESGRSVWGVVHAPVPQQTYWGGPGLGAWRRDASGTVTLRSNLRHDRSAICRILASKNHLNELTRAFIARIQPHVLLQAGSSLKFCRLAEGQADVYPRMSPTCEWDTAAAQAVLEGAGGSVINLQGHPLAYSKPELLNPHFIAAAPGWLLLAESSIH